MASVTTAAGTFEVPTAFYFVLNGVPSLVHGKPTRDSWHVKNPLPLLSGAPKWGSDPDVVPNADGAEPNPLWLAPREHTLDIDIYETPWNGTAVDGLPGVVLNILKLNTRWAPVPANPTSVVPLTMVMPDASTWSADVQILAFDVGTSTENMPHRTPGLLRIFIPDGQLTLDP